MLQDLKFGLRLLLKDKPFTITALLTLALCIGANTAIFTVLNTVILNPLPYPEPDRLVSLYNIYPGVGVMRGANGVPDYLDRKQMTDVFDSVTIYGESGYDMGAQGAPVRVDGLYVTPSYFRILRAAPMLGRAFTEDDAVFGKDRFVILSYGLWRDRFASDPAILGKDIRLSGLPYRVIGVMPAGFRTVESQARLWVPFSFRPEQTTDDARHNNNWAMIARLKPGVSRAYAQQRIDIVNRRNIERFPQYRKLLEDARFGTVVTGLKDELVSDIKPTLYLLQGAVLLVLLIGCVNVANLLLVRSNLRIKEIAIRFSLGAGRARLARQLLMESVILGLAGGALGMIVAYEGVQLLASLGAADLPRGAGIRIDAPVLGFAALVAIVTGLVFGSVPLFHLFRRDLNVIFRERTGTAQKGALWTRSALVSGQVALAFILLIGSGLLTLSFARLLAVSPGFEPQDVLTARIALPNSRYKDQNGIRNFTSALADRVRAIPGVEHAGIAILVPFGNSRNASVMNIEGYTRAPGENPPVPSWNHVDPEYFKALTIPLLQGRTFTAADGADKPKVAVIDQFLAKRYWPKGNAIGAKVRRGIDAKDPVCTVVGVVGNVKSSDLAENDPVGEVYFPYDQFPDWSNTFHLVIKTHRQDAAVMAEVRREVLRLDPELSLFDVKTLSQRISSSILNRRAAMVICLVFAALALALAAIGIYGVLAYTVTQRIREFGIRMALGAGAWDVLGMVIGHGLKLAAIGLAVGVVGAIALTRLMTTLLFGVKPTDPGVFIVIAAALMAVAAIASLIPALRAVRVQPGIALRYE